MPFGVTHNEIVIIDRTATGPRAHIFKHSERSALITQQRTGAGIDIIDATGIHHYPTAAITGLHFETAPWYANATIQLWQDKYGIGQPGTRGAARLYLVDPDQPDTALPIHPSRTIPTGPYSTFRAVAGELIEGRARLSNITDDAVPLASLDRGAHVATWHHGGGHVEIITEHRPNSHGPIPAAGDGAVAFIGLEDMNADARR